MKYIPLAARVCLSLIFLKAGIDHLLNFSGFQQTIAGMELPLPGLLAVGAIAFLLVGSILLLIGYKVQLAAILLIVFLIPTTLIFHAFWSDPTQLNAFLKNLGLIGGLLLVIYTGAGAVSIDGSSRASSRSSESVEV